MDESTKLEIFTPPSENDSSPGLRSNSSGTLARSSSLKKRRTQTLKKKKKQEFDEEKGEEERGSAFFSCQCNMCQAQRSRVQVVRQKEDLSFLTDTPTAFAQLIEWMFPSSDKIKGAQILFPDTVFFEEGKPAFIARIDKEGCLVKVTQASKLGLQEIRQRFSTIVRERKRETSLYIPGAPDNNFGSATMTGTTQAMPSFNMPLDKQPSTTGESGGYYRDVAIIRYNRRPQ